MVSQLTQRKLFGLKSKVRALYAMFGISVLITLLAGIILITFGLDWWLRGPWFFRLVVNVGALAALVYCFYRFLFYPLAVKMHLDDMALCVERGYPGLKDRLISSIQLARRYDPNDTFNSSAMVRALVSETEQVTRAMRFGAVARMHGRLVLFAVTALAGLGILVGGSVLDSRLPGIWFKRIVLLSEGDPYPKKWELGVEEENLKELSSVPKGDSVRIVVRVTHVSEDKSRIYSGRPPRIEYYYTSEDRQHREKDLMEFEGEPNRYYIGLTSVTGNVRFIIKGPSGTEERDFIPVEGEVIVVPRPEIVAVMHQIKLPAYSRKTGFTSSDGGHMSAPRGSKIRVIVHSNRDVRKGKLVFVRSGDKSKGKGESEAEPDSIELTRP
ncbi:MAG: hypothetical protein ABIH04_00320, partial [Planctomycetota bacterium]